MKPQAQIEYKPLSELKELPGNPRTISKAQFDKLKKSIQDNADYFEARPIILSDRTGDWAEEKGHKNLVARMDLNNRCWNSSGEFGRSQVVICDAIRNAGTEEEAEEIAKSYDEATAENYGLY